MYKEYKVITCKVKEAEEKMNALARDGWKAISVTPNIAQGYGLVIVMERDIR